MPKAAKEPKRKDPKEPMFRSFDLVLEREKINESEREMELSFASEAPVERYDWGEDKNYHEILSHDEGGYDFDRLNNNAPFLLSHDARNPDNHIGVVKKAWVDRSGDKPRSRAIVKFSDSPRAMQFFKDMKDGIRPKISVGYNTKGMIKSEKEDGELERCYMRWAPHEISSVAVPADDDVGTDRSQTIDSENSPNVKELFGSLTENDKTMLRTLLSPDAPAGGGNGNPAPVQEPPKIDVVAERKSAQEQERLRVKEITETCEALIKDVGDKVDKNGQRLTETIRGLANQAIINGTTVPDFKTNCFRDVFAAKPAEPVLMHEIDPKGAKNYSLLRAIQSVIKQGVNGALPDGYEGDWHQEIMRRAKADGGTLSHNPKGFQVPADAPIRLSSGSEAVRSFGMDKARDMQATIFGAGGAFVPTQLLVPIIELLRNLEVLNKLGVTTMAGLQGNIVIPRQEAAATAYVVSEIGLITASQQVLGQISMTPHRVGATQPYSKQFLLQSTPDAEAFMRDDLFTVIALQWDRLGINGQGANSEPLGIMNTPGIGSITWGGTASYANVVNMETQIRAANVRDPLAYTSTPTTKGRWKVLPETLVGSTVVSGSTNALWKGQGEEGMVNGWLAVDSNQIPNNQVICGAFKQLIRALWGGLDVVVDQFTKAANGEIVITINTYGDFAVRHPQAFVASTDSGAQ